MLLKELRARAPAMLRGRRADRKGFEARNFKRWRKAFDLLEMIMAIAYEASDAFARHFHAEADADDDTVFQALVAIHARCLLVASEVLCLMGGGYADGAIARWRTLYELNVVALFIRDHGPIIAARYLVHADVQAAKAARAWNAAAKAGDFEPHDPAAIAMLESRAVEIKAIFGDEMENQYGWASPALNGAKKPNFRQIEDGVDMGHWRGVYQWACAHNHGGHHPSEDLLGQSERDHPLLLAGASNSGMTSPLALVAASLTHVTSTLLFTRLNLDRLVAARVLMKLSQEIGPVARKAEAKSLAKFHKSLSVALG
ncbi:DUF5677 domain-containing protein [Caulobacter rhizosphaerae]|uniref:DUF5677 domain-containing protein n=1 Tax=Caulobacter rhizosphaerae TaxID=2010972 RepID=UPI0013D50EAC|nr:DUF5677 domain-containing protein [Caulobacter rhizosphaerae]